MTGYTGTEGHRLQAGIVNNNVHVRIGLNVWGTGQLSSVSSLSRVQTLRCRPDLTLRPFGCLTDEGSQLDVHNVHVCDAPDQLPLAAARFGGKFLTAETKSCTSEINF